MIDQEITEFINDNHVVTICCVENNIPYCFNCLYSVMEKEGCLVFKSSKDTRHVGILEDNNRIAGTILPDEFSMMAIRGIQFEGVAIANTDTSIIGATTSYYSKYPLALPMLGKLWIVEMTSIKFTDNTKGFGYKNIWKKQSAIKIPA